MKCYLTRSFMAEVERILKNIHEKINLLVEENKNLRQRVSELVQESSHYRDLSEEKEKTVHDLKSQTQVITAARNLEQKADPEQVRVKIDELVREIDRCINLLSR